jgi:hypothetical protein
MFYYFMYTMEEIEIIIRSEEARDHFARGVMLRTEQLETLRVQAGLGPKKEAEKPQAPGARRWWGGSESTGDSLA